MIKTFLTISFLIVNINARENPFFPSNGEQDLPFTSNQVTKLDPLESASITLPSTARIIKKVTIEYENLDASVASKDIELNNSVDWHLPIFVSQSYGGNKPSKKKKSLKHKKVIGYESVAKIKYANFLVADKSMKIITDDSLLRNFLLAQPHRIVLDFKRDAKMNSYIKSIKNSVFTKVRIGNHNSYYRAVIELDGHYRYKLKKQSNGYLISVQ